MSFTSFLSLFSFLIDPTFWSRLGFLISYIATSFLVLEVVRLVSTDVNKRDVEKFLESYSKQRTGSPRRRTDISKTINVSIEDLERPITPPTRPRRRDVVGMSPESDKTLVEERRRRRLSSQSPPYAAGQQHLSTSTSPVKKLRKRSDTLNDASSGEMRRPVRRHREASPASEAGSKASSRHGSPRRKEERKLSGGLGRVRTKV
ncbi:hypothetical protein CC86DRAFT_195831 [Ophiobolus disseminans]|uniref:Uncharacterized protein n=1 Tax=Ophiobolus disseminans TaxID=1469910 RepID=A0A6A7A5Q7_9PLEO|nr:hypothetical protein CC86DRAFT_195831 [Ophiobolus disseminans]